MITFQEYDEFAKFWAVELDARGEAAAEAIERDFGAHRRAQSAALVELAARLADPPGPPPVSDGPPGVPSCSWCGRADPPAGLQDQSMGGPPSYSCAEPDLDQCLAVHDERVTRWRDLWHPSAGMGWHEVEHHVLTGLAEGEDIRLDAAEAAMLALSAWRAVSARGEPGDGLDVALSGAQDPPGPQTADRPADAPVPGPAPLDFAAAHWSHTMRNPRNRAHTLGHARSVHPRVTSAPDAIAAREARHSG